MFNLNFDEGSPIAYITGGEYDSMASLLARGWVAGQRVREHARLFQFARFSSSTLDDEYPASDSETNDYSTRPTTPWVRTVVSGVDLLRNAKYVVT